MTDAEPAPPPRPVTRAFAGLTAAAVGAAYVLAVRPRLLRWGATTQEAAGPLPGDEIVPAPRMQSTRAVTIKAPVSGVWPWLVQLGAGRGGMYSYDWLESAAGLGTHSADRLLPALQHLNVGDIVPLSPGGGLEVRVLEPGSVLALGGTLDLRTGRISPAGAPPAGPRLDVGWTFVLRPAGPHATRLVSRTRYDYSPVAAGVAFRALLEPAQFLAERRMLLGIRSRAQLQGRPMGRRSWASTARRAGRLLLLRLLSLL